MENIFISNIEIFNVRNIKPFKLDLDENQRKNLIITGKNGSGKTTLLNEIRKFLSMFHSEYSAYKLYMFNLNTAKRKLNTNLPESKKADILLEIKSWEEYLKKFGGVSLKFCKYNTDKIENLSKAGDFIIAFFDAKRSTNFNIPTGINKVDLKRSYAINDKANQYFLQYIVNLKADKSFAKDDNDLKAATEIDNWFLFFEQNLFRLFDIDNVELKFDRKEYNFKIIEKDKEPYNLSQLSDGYSSILRIAAELIMRMENHKIKNYDVQGVVIIDEIEAHLHVDLQKKILPFLTSFFPKIQFIVSTHSPFVLSSIENTIICDLEKGIVTEDFSGYSYDTIIESYFDSDKYSEMLKGKISKYESLLFKDELNEEETSDLNDLRVYFNKLPKVFSDELFAKLQELRIKELDKKV
jgi:predicted ATP-binding protein involved in virulence